MSTKHPLSGPNEQELRDHFGDKLPADAKLMRPDHTTIWALEDGTLLWDWRNGYADLAPQVKTLVYVTSKYPERVLNLTKYDKHLDRDRYINTVDLSRSLDLAYNQESCNTVVVSTSACLHSTRLALQSYAERNGTQFVNIEV